VSAQPWRHPWQVVRRTTLADDQPAAEVLVCSHRWRWSAEVCALLRPQTMTVAHEVRRNPMPDRDFWADWRRRREVADELRVFVALGRLIDSAISARAVGTAAGIGEWRAGRALQRMQAQGLVESRVVPGTPPKQVWRLTDGARMVRADG